MIDRKGMIGAGDGEVTANPLGDAQVGRFIEDGFVHLEQVVPPEVVAAGRAVIWGDLGQRPDDPSSWTEPVARLLPSDARPFEAAFDNPRLHAAFDQLVGVGRWLARPHLGLFVIRFPHPSDPVDTGWHIDSSFPPDDPADDLSSEDLDFSRVAGERRVSRPGPTHAVPLLRRRAR